MLHVEQHNTKEEKELIAKNKRSTLCPRVGRVLLAHTLINRHDRAVRSAVQTARRTTSSQGDIDLMH